MKFGMKVKSLRENKKMTQQELADAIGVSLKTVANYETRGVMPRYRDVYKLLATALDTSITDLLNEDDEWRLFDWDDPIEIQHSLDHLIQYIQSQTVDEKKKREVVDSIQEAYYISRASEK